MRKLTAVFIRDVIQVEGSSRPVGLLRMILGATQWAEHAASMSPHSVDTVSPLSALFFLGSTAMVLGIASRECAFLLGAVEMGLVLYQPHGPWGHHHTWLLAVSTFLLAFTPCDRSFSLDRLLAVRRAIRDGRPLPLEHGPLWATRLVALQLGVVYACATIDKLNIGFLSGERLEMMLAENYAHSQPVRFPGWAWIMRVCSWSTVALEAALAVAMWFRQTRGVAFLVAVVLHAVLYLAIPVGTFSVTSVALWIVVFDPNALHKAIDQLLGHEVSPA